MMEKQIPTWHREALERKIDHIILWYTKADGFVFSPSNLEAPFRVEGDYNGSIPTNAVGALRYYEEMLTPHNRTRSPEFVGQVSWLIEFINKIIEKKDFSLDDLQLETRQVEIRKGRWPW
jgi:hypothetical protein